MGSDLTIYDKTEIFKEQDYLRMLKETCIFLGIPFVFQAAVKNTESSTEYVTAHNLDEESLKRIFDLSSEFQKMCAGLLEKLRIFCSINLIPFYFCAVVKRDTEATDMIQEGNFCESNHINLADDKITDHLRICNGFVAVPPKPEPGEKSSNNFYAYDFYRSRDMSHIGDIEFN